jgi:hypothetical protein
MVKKIIPLADWVSASDAAQLLSDKMGRPVRSRYIRTLSKSKRQPVQTQTVSNRLLYNRADILRCEVKQKAKKEDATYLL